MNDRLSRRRTRSEIREIIDSLGGERDLLYLPRETPYAFPSRLLRAALPILRGHPVTPRSTARHSQARLSPVAGGCRLIPSASERPALLSRFRIGSVGWRLHHPPAQTPANGVGFVSHRLRAKHSPFSASRSLRQAAVASAPNNESFAPYRPGTRHED